MCVRARVCVCRRALTHPSACGDDDGATTWRQGSHTRVFSSDGDRDDAEARRRRQRATTTTVRDAALGVRRTTDACCSTARRRDRRRASLEARACGPILGHTKGASSRGVV